MLKRRLSAHAANISLCLAVLTVLSGCEIKTNTQPAANGNGNGAHASTDPGGEPLPEDGGSKRVLIDGSSTVYPISQAVAEEFQRTHSDVKVVVGTSGTGGGFKKFVAGETDINDASRPIKEKEIARCKESGIEFLELKVAIDGISVVINPDNDWCKTMTVAQLKKLWEPGSKVKNWNELDPSWPEEEIKLYGPDTDSGTFDYFTDVICGEEGASRADYTPSTDDNVLVRGVSGEKYALGYFGFAYYLENADKLKAIAVSPTDDAADAVAPNSESIEGGQYKPLARPLYLYVNKAKLARPEVAEFLTYFLEEGQVLVGDVGYVKLGAETHAETLTSLKEAIGN
ncbi:MAG: hypothetical protein CMJ78_25410 [Planctomycetaceae bacterium]|nr:hypothetical protein [Planctomycetaceae bacterium]